MIQACPNIITFNFLYMSDTNRPSFAPPPPSQPPEHAEKMKMLGEIQELESRLKDTIRDIVTDYRNLLSLEDIKDILEGRRAMFEQFQRQLRTGKEELDSHIRAGLKIMIAGEILVKTQEATEKLGEKIEQRGQKLEKLAETIGTIQAMVRNGTLANPEK